MDKFAATADLTIDKWTKFRMYPSRRYVCIEHEDADTERHFVKDLDIDEAARLRDWLNEALGSAPSGDVK